MKKNVISLILFILFIIPLGILFYGFNDEKTGNVSTNSNVRAVQDSADKSDNASSPQTYTSAQVPIPGKPTYLVIPALNINAQVEHVAENEEGRMDVPKKDENVAWWRLGAIPGQMGSAVFAGHYDRKDGGPAVFYELERLNIGDGIEVLDENGERRLFEVFKKEVYKDETFPLQEVFASNDAKRLNLITCEGVFDRATSNYSDRLVVFSEMVE